MIATATIVAATILALVVDAELEHRADERPFDFLRVDRGEIR